jgi:hypothetical protein
LVPTNKNQGHFRAEAQGRGERKNLESFMLFSASFAALRETPWF